MATRYNPKETEPKWRAAWARAGTFRAQSAKEAGDKPKAYVLEMFPYPSGRLHMGHLRNYAMGDVIARFRRANGYNVLHPMGWDAFGLPAENAAIEKKAPAAPMDATEHRGDEGAVRAAGPRHRLVARNRDLRAGLLQAPAAHLPRIPGERSRLSQNAKVNWDPVDNTVLANEQVVDGKGWRSGAPVETRELEQWMFRVTAYADDLLAALDTLDRWPDKVRLMQANWIGKSQGARFRWQADQAGRRRRRTSRSSRRGRTRCSARASSRWRPIIR